MGKRDLVMVALSGGVDSAVAALCLKEAGLEIQCLHMTNWEEDQYCEAASDFQDARKICQRLGLPLHRVNFSKEYRTRVFDNFLKEYKQGRTPNPDILCNREIKFGVFFDYARRLGAQRLATGHYARIHCSPEGMHLLKGLDTNKEQSYFLHAVYQRHLSHVLFPLGQMRKPQVRNMARRAGLPVSEKKSSTGLCFIGERPFQPFLKQYLSPLPGPIKNQQGQVIGEHRGLPYYTVGQRQGLRIGGLTKHPPGPWYVAEKNIDNNEILVVQGRGHPLLFQNWLEADLPHWINQPPQEWSRGTALRCTAKIRYRQADTPCTVKHTKGETLEVSFDTPQRSVTPGQYVVFYRGEYCLGGARIHRAEMREQFLASAV